MNLDERLRDTADEIRAAAGNTPVPSLDDRAPAHGHQARRVVVIAAAGVLAVGGLAVLFNERSSSSPDRPSATQPAETVSTSQRCRSERGSPTDLDAEPVEWLQYGQYTRWSDIARCPVRVDVISQYDGPEHCDWQGVDFLTVGRPIGTSFEDDQDRADTYVWDPDDRLADVDDIDRGRRIDVSQLPSTATDTGYRLDGVELWLDNDNREVAYRVDGSNVEVLVRDAPRRLLCL